MLRFYPQNPISSLGYSALMTFAGLKTFLSRIHS